MEIGPAFRDYAPPPVYQEATRRFRGTAKLGPDGELLDYRAGQPFPMDELDCAGDPDAGTKLIWNFVHRWQGFGATEPCPEIWAYGLRGGASSALPSARLRWSASSSKALPRRPAPAC